MFCAIPTSLTSSLEYKHKFIDVSLWEEDGEGKELVSQVRVPRLEPVDRREFNLSLCTMVFDINDQLLQEWLVYNILLGISLH